MCRSTVPVCVRERLRTTRAQKLPFPPASVQCSQHQLGFKYFGWSLTPLAPLESRVGKRWSSDREFAEFPFQADF
jgi:hypothetical protein